MNYLFKGVTEQMEKKSIYTCPYCGEKTFNPLTKALAGGIASKGHACPKCNHHAVNGKACAVISAIIYVIALVVVFYIYFIEKEDNTAYIYMAATIILAFIITRLIYAFAFPLIKVVRNDV